MILKTKIKYNNFSIFNTILIFSIMMVMFKSQNLYFTWRLPVIILTYLGVITSLCYACTFSNQYRKVNRVELCLILCLISLFFYDFLIITEFSIVSFINYIGVIWISSFLLISDIHFKARLLNIVTKFYQILIAISLGGWILYLIGVPFPSYYSETTDYYSHTVYYLFLLNGSPSEQFIPRFAGMFMEPGHLGTISCFLLYINNYNLKKKGNIVLLLGILFSLSLAAYGLLIGGVGLYYFFKSKSKLLISIIFVSLFTSAWLLSYNYNDGDNIINNLIFSRLMFEDGEMAGNNRTSSYFDYHFENYVGTSKAIFGYGKEAFGEESRSNTNLTIACAGWKRYFFIRGYVGSMLLIIFWVLYLYKNWSLPAFSFFILFVMANAIRDYPLKENWLFIFIMALPVLTHNHQKTVNY